MSEKKYIATSVFKIEDNNNSNFNLSSEFSAIAAIAGIDSLKSTNTDSLLERITAREFILDMNAKTLLENDPFFNDYDPSHKDPFWKSTLKEFVFGKQIKTENTLVIENNIITKFKKFVKPNLTDGGAISIAVTHKNPESAANYANTFMQEVRNLVETENDQDQDSRLSYLSETLADALQEMEAAQQDLKEYALKNSAMAQENFISGSLKLDDLRMEKRKVEEISNVLSVITQLINSDDFNEKSYKKLRLDYPLVDDVSFRRILGMSETISAWTWPLGNNRCCYRNING